MLTTSSGSIMRARPMHALLDRDGGCLWFITDQRGAKAQEIKADPDVCVAFADPPRTPFSARREFRGALFRLSGRRASPVYGSKGRPRRGSDRSRTIYDEERGVPLQIPQLFASRWTFNSRSQKRDVPRVSMKSLAPALRRFRGPLPLG
jgi:Pyridoxamine 5'-phosphate oxidase like